MAEQLDLFSVSADRVERDFAGRTVAPVISCETLDDGSLLAAIPDAGVRDCAALVIEAGRRRLIAAIPVLEALCRRFTGFGRHRSVPEQAAALDALDAIGGAAATQALVRLIAGQAVQGPCLRQAITTAARRAAKLPSAAGLVLLQHDDPQIRTQACRCVRPGPEAVRVLHDLLDDLHAEVRRAAACALGRMGRGEVRGLLVRYLREEPTAELVDAIASIADDECVVLLGRVARATPDLSEAVIGVLRSIDHPRANTLAAGLAEDRLG